MERNIFVNEVLYCNDEEQLYRVLWISAGQEYGYWIPVDGKMNGIPVKFDCKKVAGELAEGIITSADDPITFRDINMTAEAMEQRDEWWRILKPVLESEPDIYERKRRGELLAEAAEKNGKSKTNLYRYIIKYWKRGKTPNAFLQDYRNCGKGEKTQANKKLGRPVVHEGGFGKILTEKDVKNFKSAIRKYYLNRKGASMKAAYEKMLGDYYSVSGEGENGQECLRLLPMDQIPSIYQFQYWYRKNRDEKTEAQKRGGDAKFELTGRAITGRSDYQLMGPGAKYQIDATVGDIYLVSQFNRKDIIGRPVMYFVMDSYSRMVTGMLLLSGTVLELVRIIHTKGRIMMRAPRMRKA